MDELAGIRQVSPEVFYSDGQFRAVGPHTIEFLKSRAATSPKRRCRLCFHADATDLQQEMLIVMHKSSYVRPHRHHARGETVSIFEGECEALVFDEEGSVAGRVPMSPAADGGCFFYRMPTRLFHTLVFQSEWLVFAETTIGPFDPSDTEGAAWAPPETDPTAGQRYLSGLDDRA